MHTSEQGTGPDALSEAFVNSGSLSCFQASINIQVLCNGKELTFIKHLLQARCFHTQNLVSSSKQLCEKGVNIFIYLIKMVR